MYLKNKRLCSGCHACYNICPENCISMVKDSEGFLYPKIDSGKCINCGLCDKICPVLNEYKGNDRGKAYACINKDENMRLKSSSGGIFTLIAKYVLDKNGIVFGASFNENFSVSHIEVTNENDLEKLRGSKYLQSTIGDVYKSVKDYLKHGKLVLFTGTPCQISGLKAYLQKDYENLILQDIICHGVPSPEVWDKYLKFREKKNESAIQKTYFRNKKQGWKKFSVFLEYDNSTKYLCSVSDDTYMASFLANLTLRPSCYDCHSKSLNRESDITLADFWGIENVCPELDDDKGTSLVFVNSEKGRNVFEEIKEQLIFRQVDIDEAVRYNPSAYISVNRPKNRENFLKDITENNFDKIVNKYTKPSFVKKCFNKAKRIIKRIITK